MTEARPLAVRLSGYDIGELRPNGSFAWYAGVLAGAPLNTPVLSHSLPFGAAVRDSGPFFGGLLPEGLGLERLVRETRVASNDLYGLLAEVGADVGGSVTIGEPRPPVDPIAIDADAYERILEQAYGYLRGSTVGGGGSSATGVQQKIALTREPASGRWSIGRGSTPSTHILKPVAIEQAAVIHAEAYLQALAGHLGLASHHAWVEPAGHQAVLIVERYDRVYTDPAAGRRNLRRLHQEDAAQALSLPWGSNDKYESVNPAANLRAIAGLLDRGRSLFATGRSDRERLLALVTLNVVAGNTDAHAKNFSVMLPAIDQGAEHSWSARLAPAYDIVPQSFFNFEQSPYAMRIAGESQPNAVTAAHLAHEGEGWGLRPNDAQRVVRETLSALADEVGRRYADESIARLPHYLLERITNLQSGDPVWLRSQPPALSFG